MPCQVTEDLVDRYAEVLEEARRRFEENGGGVFGQTGKPGERDKGVHEVK